MQARIFQKLGGGSVARSLLNRGMSGATSGGGGANAEMAASSTMQTMGVIPAQTQLSTALAINLGTNGRPVRGKLEMDCESKDNTRFLCLLLRMNLNALTRTSHGTCYRLMSR